MIKVIGYRYHFTDKVMALLNTAISLADLVVGEFQSLEALVRVFGLDVAESGFDMKFFWYKNMP